MIVEDFVCLGRTVPEESKKYGHKVCMAGYSFELGQFLRVYPLPVQNPLKANRKYVLSLCRNSSDSRFESWKLTDRIALYESKDKVYESDLRRIFTENVSESIAILNDRRASIGVVRPLDMLGEFDHRANCGETQMDLFDHCDHHFGADAINAIPYLRFMLAGKSHRLQLREWGCYEWIRKNPCECAKLWNNLRLKEQTDKYLLVGNMANHRNVWLVIKSFSMAIERQLSLICE